MSSPFAILHKKSRYQTTFIRRLIRLIPFEVEIAEDNQDTKLLDKLLPKGEEILAWTIRECLDWQKGELGIPAAVKDAS